MQNESPDQFPDPSGMDRSSVWRGGRVSGNHILVVDDHPVNRLLARKLLQGMGYVVGEAEDGLIALQRLEEQRYDLVLMDCDMPNMDGLSATREIRRREAVSGQCRIPVLALTAQPSGFGRAACLEAGMDDFMNKPFRSADLYERVGHLLALARAAQIAEPSAESDSSDHAKESTMENKDLARMDNAVLDELREALGEDLGEIVVEFLGQLQHQLEQIAAAVEAANPAALSAAAHSLKGSAANLGASGLADYAAALEKLGKQGGLEGTEQGLAVLCDSAAQTISALKLRGYSIAAGSADV